MILMDLKQMIKYIQKDITTVETGIIAHGVNCKGVMRSGVARAIRHKWPVVYDVYVSIPSRKSNLGTCSLVEIWPERLYVANCYTQELYGRNGRFASPRAIEDSLWKAYEWADFYHLPMYMPKIGAGLGGLDWETEVKPIIELVDGKWVRTDTYICIYEESTNV